MTTTRATPAARTAADRSSPLRRPLARALLAAGLATCAVAAQAVPVSVSIGGLPPGLSATLTVQRNVCPDGMGWVSNASQALTETSHTTYEMVQLPGGGMTLRQRVVTRYTANFDTPVTPAQSNIAYEVRCSAVNLGNDLFRFGVRIAGVNASDQAATMSGVFAEALQSAPVSVNSTLAAKTVSFTPTANVLSRGVVNSFEAGFGTSLGTVQAQRLDLLRPHALIFGMFTRVASLYVRSDGAACVQAGSTTRCLGETTSPTAGGVILRGLQRNPSGQPGVVRFQFELAQSFPIGTLKLRAAADASDLAGYMVDGDAQPLDLLPWQPMEQTLTVQ